MPTKKTETDARQGENSGRMPFVLGLSVLFIIVAFSGVYGYTMLFSAHQPHATHSSAVAR